MPDYLKIKLEIQEVYEKHAVLKAEYDAKPEVQKFNVCVPKVYEYKQKLWKLNLQSPEFINSICKDIVSRNIELFGSGNISSYILSSKQFEELIDEYLIN